MKETPELKLVKHISFIDCPGHDQFISTMLGGSSLMDAALMVVAANEGPQAQTEEHLLAMDIIQMKQMAILQNKTELIPPKDIPKSVEALHEFTQGTVAETAPVIPISANLGKNMDAVCKYIAQLPTPMERLEEDFLFACVRSFCVNACGTLCAPVQPDTSETPQIKTLCDANSSDDYLLKGAVLGGSILRGKVQVGSPIEIRPGKVQWQADGTWVAKPYMSYAKALKSDTHHLEVALPGGCVAIQTFLDPGLGRDDGLVGQLAGKPGTLPPVYHQLNLEAKLIRNSKNKLQVGQTLLLQVLTSTISANVVKIKKLSSKRKLLQLELSKPICAQLGKTIAISQSNKSLIGYGVAISGEETPLILSECPPDKSIPVTLDEVLSPLEETPVIQEEALIDSFQSFMEARQQNTTRLSLKPPQLVKDGGKRFRWTNAYQIVEQLNRSIESLQKFIKEETQQRVNLNHEDKVMILHGAFKKKQINSILVSFAQKKIQCQQCKSFKTDSKMDGNLECIVCQECKAERYLE